MGGQSVQVLRLQRHALANHALETRETDAHLVLQQFADRTDAAVAQVVDIVRRAQTHLQVQHIADRRENIVNDDMLRNQFVDARAQRFLERLLVVAGLFENLRKHRIAHALLDAALRLRVKGDVLLDVDHAVGEDFHLVVVDGQIDLRHAGVVHLLGKRAGDGRAGLRHDLARRGVDDRAREDLARDAAGQIELFIVLIPADAGKVVAAGVEEQAV